MSPKKYHYPKGMFTSAVRHGYSGEREGKHASLSFLWATKDTNCTKYAVVGWSIEG